MGVLVSRFKRRRQEELPEMKPLTMEQIEVIQQTWKVPGASPMDTGEIILLQFFDKYPMHQNYFDAFKNTPLLSLKGTPGFRTHASRIMRVISEAVNVLGKPGDVPSLLRIFGKIGESHAKYYIDRRAFIKLTDTFINVLEEEYQIDEDAQAAWGTFLNNGLHIIFTAVAAKLRDTVPQRAYY